MSIRLEHVSYAYEDNSSKKNYALKDVNLEIKKEEFIAVIGHTGSGKSTLIQHLNGLIRPTSGKIYFDDEDIYADGYPLRELRGKVGICFQYPEHQLFETTILDDVCFGPMNFGKTKEEAKEIAIKCLKDVGLPEKLYEKSPFELSGGQKRRVAIAGILAMEPEYFILDEPTAGLDPVGKDQILNLLKELHEEKKITIILVSHSMEDVADYAQRVIVMNHGQVMYEGDKKEVFSHKKELEAAGLAVPFYRQVCEELADRGFPIQRDLLTLEETKEAIKSALAYYEKEGAEIVDVSIPHITSGVDVYYIIAPAEASSNLARYDGVGFGYRASGKDIVDMYIKSRSTGFGEEVKRRIMIGNYVLSAGYYDAYYLTALKVRTLLKREFEKAFEQCDILAAPSASGTAFKFGAFSDPLALYMEDICTVPVNLIGAPSISIPVGFKDGMPLGMQLIGPTLGEEKILQAAYTFEQDHPEFTKTAPKGEFE